MNSNKTAEIEIEHAKDHHLPNRGWKNKQQPRKSKALWKKKQSEQKSTTTYNITLVCDQFTHNMICVYLCL